MTDAPRIKPVGDPPLTPEQLAFWREKMCLTAGIKHTAGVVIRKEGLIWLVGTRQVTESTATFLMDRARRVRP